MQPTLLPLTILTLIAFAANSVLCRIALKETSIDAGTFTSVRLISGLIVLWVIATIFRRAKTTKGNVLSGLALFVYAAGFSFAYLYLDTGIGALLLFGAVQITMISYGFFKGERFSSLQWLGFLFALVGLVGLLSPGLNAPPMLGSVLMILAGIGWGAYSLRGRGAGDPIWVSAWNFLFAAIMALGVSIVTLGQFHWDWRGVVLAILSGALASGCGYALWYTVLPRLQATTAATLQLSVPVLAAFGGVLFLSEPLTMRFVLGSIAILGGIVLVIRFKSQ